MFNLYNADGTPFPSHVGGIALTDTYISLSDTVDAAGNDRITAIPLEHRPRKVPTRLL